MIRIIAGNHKGRRISAPSNLPVRPTTDFAKEGLFNVLSNRIDFETITVLDLFAGTGNISYEFCSRGCKRITSVDQDFHCVKFMAETNEKLDFKQARVVRSDVYSFLKKKTDKYDLIFADPPYNQVESVKIPELIFQNEMLHEGGIFIMEHAVRILFPDTSRLLETRQYGKVNFSIFG
jgi:16S rRNA (guanine966-N2)-methyltransferase